MRVRKYCYNAKITHHKVYAEDIYAILTLGCVSHLHVRAKIYIGF